MQGWQPIHSWQSITDLSMSSCTRFSESFINPKTLTEPGVISKNCCIGSGSAKDSRELPICLERTAVLNFFVPGRSLTPFGKDILISAHYTERDFYKSQFPDVYQYPDSPEWWQWGNGQSAGKRFLTGLKDHMCAALLADGQQGPGACWCIRWDL